MDPERTTTIGEEEFVVMERPFQSMNAVLRTRAKFRIWVKSWRGWRDVREENMLGDFFEVCVRDGCRGCVWKVDDAVEVVVGVSECRCYDRIDGEAQRLTDSSICPCRDPADNDSCSFV
jgi:hypothetical protein